MLPTQYALNFQIPFILFSSKIVFLSSVLVVVMLHICIYLLDLTPEFLTLSCLEIYTELTHLLILLVACYLN